MNAFNNWLNISRSINRTLRKPSLGYVHHTIIIRQAKFAESVSLWTTVGCWLRCSVSATAVQVGSQQRIFCLWIFHNWRHRIMRPGEVTPECPLYIQKQLRRRGKSQQESQGPCKNHTSHRSTKGTSKNWVRRSYPQAEPWPRTSSAIHKLFFRRVRIDWKIVKKIKEKQLNGNVCDSFEPAIIP